MNSQQTRDMERETRNQAAHIEMLADIAAAELRTIKGNQQIPLHHLNHIMSHAAAVIAIMEQRAIDRRTQAEQPRFMRDNPNIK